MYLNVIRSGLRLKSYLNACTPQDPDSDSIKNPKCDSSVCNSSQFPKQVRPSGISVEPEGIRLPPAQFLYQPLRSLFVLEVCGSPSPQTMRGQVSKHNGCREHFRLLGLPNPIGKDPANGIPGKGFVLSERFTSGIIGGKPNTLSRVSLREVGFEMWLP